MNTSAVRCRITGNSACAPEFGHYRGYSYAGSSSCLAAGAGADESPFWPKSFPTNIMDYMYAKKT
jgi:hypothetical protein